MIVPFFIPHAGCPHQCVFCNQKKITGKAGRPDPASIPATIKTYLATGAGKRPAEVAFYGGSFTALPRETQKEYLEAVRPFIESGRVEAIRLSTRPDGITNEILSFLKPYRVKTVELGAQSMDSAVLARSDRGHTAADTENAVNVLKDHGFAVGVQLIPGLPGDSAETFLDTVDKTIALKPDFVRIYPALVIKGTPLEDLYKRGEYSPLPLDDAVTQCREALIRFDRAGIPVIRIGLQPTEELEQPGTIIAGPYHPAFRQLVESSLFLGKMRKSLREQGDTRAPAAFHVSPADVSSATGRHRANIHTLEREFGLSGIRVVPDARIPRGTILLRIG